MRLKEKITNFFENRELVIKIFVILIAVIYIGRLFYLQIIQGDYYRNVSAKKMVRNTTIEAPRGEIYDRNGVILASNKIGYDIVIYRTQIDNSKLNQILINLINIIEKNNDKFVSNFDIENEQFVFYSDYNKQRFYKTYGIGEELSYKDIIRKLYEKYELNTDEYTEVEKIKIIKLRYEISANGYSLFKSVTLARNVSYETMASIEQLKLELPGVEVVQGLKRYYPYNTLLSHVLGYVSSIDSDEYENLKNQGYSQNSIIGKLGLEAFLESYLKGQNGVMRTEVNSMGVVRSEYIYKETVSGNNVTLTIDSRLQEISEKALKNMISTLASGAEGKEYMDASAGTVVITDVNTGEVLSLASFPNYDPNSFISGITYKDWEELLNNTTKPMYNRATQGAYAPGSTFKMLSAIAGLEKSVITKDELILDTGVYAYGYHPVCWIYTSTGGSHGYINVSDAIKVSCNCFFYEVGRRLGIDALITYAKEMGLGEKTGIELTESSGSIAGENSKEWYLGDTLSAVIGQSNNSFTPVQISRYISAIANGGTLNRLTLIKNIEDSDKNKLEDNNVREFIEEKTGQNSLVRDIAVSDETLDAVRLGMEKSAMEVGGGVYYIFGSSKINIAGKTGTAEVSNGQANALFAGYAPAENPKISIVVVIEHGGTGGYAAKTAKTIIEEYYRLTENDNSIKGGLSISIKDIQF